jgi:hypothetical protein
MHHMKHVFLMLDAMGLVAFSLIGCNVALQLDYPLVVVIMAGMITGICGGILRDVLCNQVPVVFCRELYASVSLFVCTLFLPCAPPASRPTSTPCSASPSASPSACWPSASAGNCRPSPTSSAGISRQQAGQGKSPSRPAAASCA